MQTLWKTPAAPGLAALALTAAWPVAALATTAAPSSVVAGGTGDINAFPFSAPSGGNFTYTGEYQSLYAGADFAGPLSITSLAFASTVDIIPNYATFGTPGPQTYDFTIGLSTTDASLAAPSTDYAANKGSDFVTVFNGTLTANLTDSGNDFDLVIPTSAPFNYNPANGNLLVDVVLNKTTTGGTNFFVSGSTPGASHVSNQNGNGAPVAIAGSGLETRFGTGPVLPMPGRFQSTAIPPSSSIVGADGVTTYEFDNVASGTWTDPLGSDFQFSVLPGSPDFSAITLPVGLGDFTLTTPGGPTLAEAAGTSVSFGPGGVSQFDLFGSPTAGPLPVLDFFVGGGAGSFTQRVLPAAAVPEAPAGALFALGLLPVGLLAARRRRA